MELDAFFYEYFYYRIQIDQSDMAFSGIFLDIC